LLVRASHLAPISAEENYSGEGSGVMIDTYS